MLASRNKECPNFSFSSLSESSRIPNPLLPKLASDMILHVDGLPPPPAPCTPLLRRNLGQPPVLSSTAAAAGARAERRALAPGGAPRAR
jgi:hypothetical protein